MMNTLSKRVLIVAAFTAVAAGCGDDGNSTKAGEGSAPVTLRIGTEGGQGRPESDQIEEFARRVAALSGGGVTIEPVWEAARPSSGEATPGGADQAVAEMVQDGELDMAMIPARAWDSLGVPTFRALTAPFLVDSRELTAEATAGELADEMLGGLSEIGLTGLALFPDQLRHLFSFGEPILAPADVAGTTIRALPSNTTYAVIEALGATPMNADGDTFGAGVASGEIAAAESSFALAAPTLPRPGTATANLTLFPKVNTLVIDTDVWNDLGDERQELLQSAAAGAREWAVATQAVPESELAAAHCDAGGAVVLTTDAELTAFEEAVAPVYAELEQDETTHDVIERIRQLKADMPEPAASEPCGPAAESGVDTVEADGADTSAFPEGTYRMEMTAELLIDAGVDRIAAFDHAGVWTFGFDDGRFIDGGDPNNDGCPGSTYSVEDDRVTVQLGPDGPGCGTAAGQVLFSAGWTLDGDQLQFNEVESGHGYDVLIAALFGGQPFTKIS
jgi:TRAP-type C4-dicarboxylate transport system substrate-binding protein